MNDPITAHYASHHFILGSESPNILDEYEVLPPFIDNDKERFVRLGHSVVNTLQSWSDPGYVVLALKNIEDNFQNDVFQKFLIDKGIDKIVVHVMKSLPDDDAVQMLCCRLINVFYDRSEDLQKNMESSDVYRYILKAFSGDNANVVLQISAIRTLDRLIALDEVQDHIALDDYGVEIAKEIFSCLQKCTDNKQIKQSAYRIIKILSEDEDPDIHDICLQKDNMSMMLIDFSVPDEEDSIEIVTNIVETFICISKNKQKKENHKNVIQCLMEHDIQYTVLRKLQHSCHELILKACLRLLVRLVKEDAMKKFLLESGYIKNNLLSTMVKWYKNSGIQMAGLQLFSNLAQDKNNGIAVIDDLESQWCRIVYTAMSKHLDNPSVQAYGCKAVAVMLEKKPSSAVCIGESSHEKMPQEPIHTVCMGSLLMHRKDPKVFIAACHAIYWLAADNERLCTNLMDKNVQTVIMDGLKLHVKYPKAAEAGLKALRGLCIFNDDNKRKLVVDERIFPMISQIIDKFPEKLNIQLEATSSLACIANIDTIRYQCFLEDIHIKVIQTLERYMENETLQEVGLECLSVLSAAENAPEMLNLAGAARHAIKVLKTYSDTVYLQKKGLILIQLLADKKMCRDPDVCDGLAETLCNALVTHSDNNGVLKEACVSVQILAEIGKEISDRLINRGCHQTLFDILQTNEDEELQDLICECIHVMGLTLDLKSKMLCTCVKGILVGAECLLELGADVNYSDGENTPLCHAVRNQDEDLVRLLLTQDINDLIKPLKLSLSVGMDTDIGDIITGHILGYISDRSGKQALWNNLGLETLKSEWMTVACAKILRIESDLSKLLAYKIKNISIRKQRSLANSKSESDISRTFGRHNYFRFRLRSQSATNTQNNEDDTDRGLEISESTRRKLCRTNSESMLRIKGQPIPTPVVRQALSPIMSPRHSMDWINEFNIKPESELDSSSSDVIYPVFEISQNEADEWKSTTLTGANVPYNPSDPRYKGATDRLTIPEKLSGPWSRKSRSPSPRTCMGNNNSSEKLDVFGTDLNSGFIPMVMLDSEQQNDNIRRRINDCLSDRRPSSIDSLFSDCESRRSSVQLSDNFDVTLLDISCNKITSIQNLADSGTDFWDKFKYLQTINLSDNQLQILPGEIFQCLPTLRQFEAKKNQITEIPQSLWCCPSLKHLDLSDNKISKFGMFDTTWYNDRLVFLDLSRNEIQEIPTILGHVLPSLENLFLNCNRISFLAEDPLSLKELKVLEISCNYIKAVPDLFFCGCRRLDLLDLENNDIESLPKENVTTMLPRLTRLKLKRNCLSEKEPLYIPKFVLELQNLRKLDLSDNKITSFPPPALWRSKMLQEIKVSRNKITKLNLDGGRFWTKLETLALDSNSLSELPKEIGLLTSLTSLDISFNKSLKTLPDEMGRCSRLWEFRYRGVDLHLHRSLANGRVKDLISFLHNKLKKATAYFRMKVMVVGYGGRGKSTLLRALMKVPKPAAYNTPTVGIVVKDWVFERNRKDMGKKVVYTLSTWDLAGQEEFYSTHQCYLSNRALYLVVLRMHKGLEEIDMLKPWLSNIYARAPGCPVIVVGTHYDKVPKAKRQEVVEQFIDRLNDLTTKPGFPDIKEFCPVDCSMEKDNVELENLREKIKDTIDNYKVKGEPVMGQMVPASYVRLSDKLAEETTYLLKKSYPIISHNQLLQIVKQSSIDLDEDELKQAIRFLHECGILLHYEDASLQLKDLYFIDPGWLCRMMAQVITVRQINPFIKNGILRKADTKVLFTGKKVDKDQPFIYPPALIPQYLKLLEKFEIALPHTETELLIPCYLPDKKPVLQLPVLQKHEMICRLYIMPYIQLGLWPRLITRLITFSTSFLTKLLLEVDKQPTINYWKKGVCSIWSNNAFYLVEFHSNEKEEIRITVPNTQNGAGLMGLLVDHLDSLIEEWYPGLTTVDPYLGRELLEKLTPCVDCKGQDTKMFRLDELLYKMEQGDTVHCEVHDGMVKISALAPELMLMDFSSDIILDQKQLDFVEGEDNLLGDGGYGAVYKAMYRDKPVAVKVFAAIGDIHPLKMLRQEATVLRCLKHPSVVSLLAVGNNPRVMILELAKHLSLGIVLKQDFKLDQILQYKIALQVAEGLAYLHQMMIVYRDMKPDNVLIFSLDPKSLINAKISDYGIARFSMLDGLMLQEGTLAYRAPEVIRGETYSFKADIFSYGITLYTLLTNGKHPFSEFEFKGEMDRALAEGISIKPITEKGCPPWPGMQTLLMDCLHKGPDQRPESAVICKRLREPELLNLKQRIRVTKGLTVECLIVQKTSTDKLCLWAASGNSDVQLSRIDLQFDAQMETKGAIFQNGRILCLLPLKDDYLLIGTEECKIWLYNTMTKEYEHSTTMLSDAVLCMKHIPGSKDDLVFVGLANGTIAVFLVSDLILEDQAIPMCLSPGSEREVIRCMEVSLRGKQLYVSCGSNIIVIKTRTSISVDKKMDTVDMKRPSPIHKMVVGNKRLYLSHAKSCLLQIRNTADLTLRSIVDISQVFRIRKETSRITSLALQDGSGVLWIGTGGGHIGLIDVKTQSLIVLTQKYTTPVRSLLTVNIKGSPVVVSGGLGFQDKPQFQQHNDEDYGCIAVWDAHFASNVRKQLSAIKQRQQLVESYLSC